MNRSSEIPAALAEHIALMEKRLSDEQQKRYEAMKQKQATEQETARELLERHSTAYRAEQKKVLLAKKPEHADGSALRKYRNAAREMMVQQDAIDLLSADHERERRDFLLQATTPEFSPDPSPVTSDDRAARMQERLAAARQRPSGPQRGGPDWE